jgi:hypothetical protein
VSKPIALVAGYLVRYPLGGHILSQLHFLVGLKRLGYEVVFVEEFGWENSCYDPRTNTNTNDPGPGAAVIGPVLAQIGLTSWCYVDDKGNYHGLSRDELCRICRDAEFLLSLASTT